MNSIIITLKINSNDKEMFDFSNYSAQSRYYDNSNKLFVSTMKDKTAGAAVEGFSGLKPNICSYLVDDNSEHKKVKGVNKNVAATVSHNEYNDALFNKKYLRHSVNRIQSIDDGVGTYEINKIFFCLALMIKDTSKAMDVMD